MSDSVRRCCVPGLFESFGGFAVHLCAKTERFRCYRSQPFPGNERGAAPVLAGTGASSFETENQ